MTTTKIQDLFKIVRIMYIMYPLLKGRVKGMGKYKEYLEDIDK